MLVLMRVALGWHLLYAGLDKLNNDFSSVGFLSQAKGPFAERFRALVPDYQGTQALDKSQTDPIVDSYVDQLAAFYQFNDEQKAEAKTKAEEWAVARDAWFKSHAGPIADVDREWQRLALAEKGDPTKSEPFGAKQLWDKRSKVRGDTVNLQNELKDLDELHRADLRTLLTEEQRTQGEIPVPIGERLTIDRIVTYTNILIGACLILGLFTRLAAFGGGLFVLSIVLSQLELPGSYPPPHPSAGPALIVTKDFIYMLSLFLLSTTHVGRWGGLDFFVHNLITKPVFGRKNREASK